jgi:hypothetical protein
LALTWRSRIAGLKVNRRTGVLEVRSTDEVAPRFGATHQNTVE